MNKAEVWALTLTGMLFFSGTALAQPYEGFKNPPQDARIRVWWHWMDGNITREGIKADLDWMKATGIAGVQQFDAGGDLMMGMQPIVERKPYMQDGWKDAFRYAVHYADSLGMEFAIASAPGWSSTGHHGGLPDFRKSRGSDDRPGRKRPRLG